MSLVNIRKKAPLVHCITNYVVANFTANGLLAMGASPVMADAVEEVADMVRVSDALLLNIGTLNERTMEAMVIAGKAANTQQVPVVLDPVGVGATPFRKQFVKQLLAQVNIDLLRCNAGELAALTGAQWQAKGVDSGEGNMDVIAAASKFAKDYQCAVIITGATDVLIDQGKVYRISGGVVEATFVTGTGCLLSAVCAATLGAEASLLETLQQYKQAATIVGPKATGSFQMGFLDALHHISEGLA
ncbi:hydroxyethylthiazole kinase [Kurthia sp. 3B1D]|uniref:Hydroxyethylthiazole kinase n=1 Tax=Candidatus Kurthia intestinigallinarum TaxID=1562256 RepID=A0A433RQ88_9BACL|nr:hydroxyethylthiazole kinase [Kurthia sp. 3B1D]RUS52573.1 hydroxyethylthiazole kinase [Kurthia sp. 3B1D]